MKKWVIFFIILLIIPFSGLAYGQPDNQNKNVDFNQNEYISFRDTAIIDVTYSFSPDSNHTNIAEAEVYLIDDELAFNGWSVVKFVNFDKSSESLEVYKQFYTTDSDIDILGNRNEDTGVEVLRTDYSYSDTEVRFSFTVAVGIPEPVDTDYLDFVVDVKYKDSSGDYEFISSSEPTISKSVNYVNNTDNLYGFVEMDGYNIESENVITDVVLTDSNESVIGEKSFNKTDFVYETGTVFEYIEEGVLSDYEEVTVNVTDYYDNSNEFTFEVGDVEDIEYIESKYWNKESFESGKKLNDTFGGLFDGYIGALVGLLLILLPLMFLRVKETSFFALIVLLVTSGMSYTGWLPIWVLFGEVLGISIGVAGLLVPFITGTKSGGVSDEV